MKVVVFHQRLRVYLNIIFVQYKTPEKNETAKMMEENKLTTKAAVKETGNDT